MRRTEKDPGKTKINTRMRQRENVPDTLQSRHDNSVDTCVDKVNKEVGTGSTATSRKIKLFKRFVRLTGVLTFLQFG